eukprot:SAG31_NODE_1855_length_7064_cov_49.836324_4_plen_368_part_00
MKPKALPAVTPHGYRCVVWPEMRTEIQKTREITAAIDAVNNSSSETAPDKVIVLTAETAGFRQVCRWLPASRSARYCVEIGSAHGHATKILSDTVCPSGGRVVGIDKGNEFVRAAKKLYPTLDFQRIDVLMAPQYLVQAGAGADAVLLDINGVREIELLLPVMSLVQQLLQPSLFVVKSRHLVHSILPTEVQANFPGDGGTVDDVTTMPQTAVGLGDPRWWQRMWQTISIDQSRTMEERVPPPVEYSFRWQWRQESPHDEVHYSPTQWGAIEERPKRATKRYPLNYPQRFSPSGVRICEFHNFDIERGCERGRAGTCRYEHGLCHFCLAPGHIAMECSKMLAADNAARMALAGGTATTGSLDFMAIR